jgi:hypothetical protein
MFYRAHTLPATLNTSDWVAWITVMCSLSLFLNTRCQNFKVRLMLLDCRFEPDWLKNAKRDKCNILCWPADIQCHTVPVHLQQRLLRGGIGRMAADLLAQSCIKNLCEFKIKPLYLRDACSPGSNLEQAASRQSFGNVTSFGMSCFGHCTDWDKLTPTNIQIRSILSCVDRSRTSLQNIVFSIKLKAGYTLVTLPRTVTP